MYHSCSIVLHKKNIISNFACVFMQLLLIRLCQISNSIEAVIFYTYIMYSYRMKRSIWTLGLLTALIFGLFACDEPTKDTPEIKTNPIAISISTPVVQLQLGGNKSSSEFSIVKGNGSYTLEVKDKAIVKATLTKDKHVMLQALKEGKTILTIRDAKKQSLEVKVIVLPKEIKVLPIETDLTSSEVQLQLGKKSSSEFTIVMGNGNYQLEVKDKEIVQATLSKDNHVTLQALKAGKTTLTIRDAKMQSLEIMVSVLAEEAKVLPIETNLQGKSVQLLLGAEGNTTQFEITKGNGSYRLTVKDEKIVKATLSDNNKVTLHSLMAGETELTITDAKNQTYKVSVTVLSTPLSLGEKAIVIDMDKMSSTTITIQGNGKFAFQIPDDAKNVLELIVENGKLQIKVKESKKVKAKVVVTDGYSHEKAELEIQVKPKSIAQVSFIPQPISETNFNKEEVNNQRSIVEEVIKQGEDIIKRLDQIPAYDKGKHATQHLLYEASVKSFNEQKKKFEESKGTLKGNDLWKVYTEIYKCSAAHFPIERIARMTSLFLKNYPENQDFKKFDTEAFTKDSLYANLEGEQFYSTINAKLFKEYNRIVGIYNQLERN